MRLSANHLLGLGLLPMAIAQDFQPAADPGQLPGQEPAAAATSLALSRMVGGTWLTEWNAATQTPRSIFGTGIQLQDWRENSLTEARRHAEAAMVRYHDLLGLGTSEFREIIGARMGRSWSFTYDQYFKGLEAIGGRVDFRINMRGVIAMLGASAWQIPADFNTTPRLGEEVAVASAWAALGELPTGVKQPGVQRKPRLVIWGDMNVAQAPIHLAWEVPVSNVNAQGQGPIGRYYVDANTGAVLTFVSDKHECGFVGCTATHSPEQPATAASGEQPATAMPPIPTTVTVMGWTRTGNDGFSTLVNTPLAGLILNVPGLGNRTTDANGQFVIDIAAPVNINVGALDGIHSLPIVGANAPAGVFAVTPGVDTTIQLLTAAATFNEAAHTTAHWWVHRTNEWCRSILGNTAQLNTASNIDTEVNIASTCNAYYTGNSINFYAAGGGCNNTAFSSVVSHEWGHGLDDRYGGISNVTGDGLSEGWGDILGCFLTDSPILGSGFQTAGVGIRNGNNAQVYPTAGAAVHTAGQVWMGFAWRLRERLAASMPRNQAIAISQDIVISSIVADASDRPAAVREVFIADDDDGNLLNGVPHYAELSGAAIEKNLPYPERQLGTIAHTALGNTTQQLTPRFVDATVTPISGSFTAVRLHYNDGAARIRNMLGTGVANQFRALLPGRTNGSTVSYHIEAVHSTGPIVRLPASGEFTWSVGTDVAFYSEGFETGGAGWTSGLVATQNDWQIGDPFGRTGTGWADPANAATGLNCAGNDLGNTIGTQAWNGAYQNNVNNWARSPVIDCTGRTGVRLRFKRWLTVQASTADQATVWVNGAQVWINSAAANTIDNSWVQMDLPIPMADNNPAVTLEWRLVTNASTVFGGWNFDDVELVAATGGNALAAQLTLLPEQVVQGGACTIQVTTQGGPKPFVLAIGDTAGPTVIPGIPTILVGGSYFTLADWTDAGGNYSLPFNAPTPVAAIGQVWYSHVLTFNSDNSALVTSNPFVNLFTPTP